MARNNCKYLNLDVEKLFIEHNISEIIEIEKDIKVEIERKRSELRSMVGDRYKDILVASDAITSMKETSQNVASDIDLTTVHLEKLISDASSDRINIIEEENAEDVEERTIVMQIRLTILLNEEIWSALDEENYSNAAQYYLLAQHIHTGLRLMTRNVLDEVPLLLRIKDTLDSLRARIIKGVNARLQTTELLTEEAGNHLNALMLLENKSGSEVIKSFIEIRKFGLNNILQQSHTSVRRQLSAMVKCLMSTVHLLYECLISYKESATGFVWQQLEKIIGASAPPTLLKIKLPEMKLTAYIPEIIGNFRPKYTYVTSSQLRADLESCVKEWVSDTMQVLQQKLYKILESVTNIRGLHAAREEALKIHVPTNWETVCASMTLPKNFNIWHNFFQDLITSRAKDIISKKISTSIGMLQDDIVTTLNVAVKSERSEHDLRWYVWNEEPNDVSRTKNIHDGLSMKTKGYSHNITSLSEKLDVRFLDILNDISLYLYGKEYENLLFTLNFTAQSTKSDRTFNDREVLETHIRKQCNESCKNLITFLRGIIKEENERSSFILKSLTCARLLQGITCLCPHFKECCCINQSDDWDKMCSDFTAMGVELWQNWVDDIIDKLVTVSKDVVKHTDISSTLSLLLRWEIIDIQEQTEEKVFKSQIKVPSHPSSSLQHILTYLNDRLNQILPHTLPKPVHINLIEKCTTTILRQYDSLLSNELNQRQALQYLFDVKFLTILSIPRENMKLIQKSQAICDKLRSKIDPFDLDVFYPYVQDNIKRCVLQFQVIYGCLVPSSTQLASLGVLEKNKEQEREPSVLALSIPSITSWFPLLPVTTPAQKLPSLINASQQKDKGLLPRSKSTPGKLAETTTTVKSSAVALFGAMANDWF